MPMRRSLPCGPGKPLEGQPKGCPSVPRIVYSCSMPNKGCWFSTISMIFLHVKRRLVSVQKCHLVITKRYLNKGNHTSRSPALPAGFRLYFSTSHRTSLLGSLRNGSRNIAEGIKYISLLEPSDWYVLEPSKFHSGSSTEQRKKRLLLVNGQKNNSGWNYKNGWTKQI